MKYALKACVAAMALVAAMPAAAAVIYNGTTYDVGDTINISFVGSASDGGPGDFEGVTGDLALTLMSDGSNYVFEYNLLNTTSDPDQPDVEISAFGFNIDPDITGATEDGPLTVSSGNISNGTSLEFCLTAGPNCAGGGSGGIASGENFEGEFTLMFGSDPLDITITSPTIRFQSSNTTGEGSGIGTPGVVPEPGTWAMMLMGFGAAGYAMRRRRRIGSIAQLA
jgi:hypothetical protein